MGCSESKHHELDSDDSYTSSVSTKKSKRNASPKNKPSSSRKPVKSKQTKGKPSTASAAKNARNVDQVDGNKASVPQLPQHQETKHVNSAQSMRPATTTMRKSGWTDEQLLSQLQYLDVDTSSNIVRLFDEGNTIPFMCRYRRELIGNLDADKCVIQFVINTKKNFIQTFFCL